MSSRGAWPTTMSRQARLLAMLVGATLGFAVSMASDSLAALPQQAGAVDLATQANSTLSGAAGADWAGHSVAAAGDVNGDGVGDTIVGAPRAGLFDAGAAYVVFGKESRPDVDLGLLTSSGDGFRIGGVDANDQAGFSVAGAGDVNGDGLDDVIVGAPFAQGAGTAQGAAYIVFGKSTTDPVMLADLEAEGTGFRIDGGANFDVAGFSVAGAGDVNGDGLGDVVLGAPLADCPMTCGNPEKQRGAAYVVFGKTDTAAVDLDGFRSPGNTAGFRFDGIAAGYETGFSLGGTGDVNGDGLADVVIGSPFSDEFDVDAGAAYVVFGKQDTANLDAEDFDSSGDGYRIQGGHDGDQAGFSVAGAGDFNADGVPDTVVGSNLFANSPTGTDQGLASVVFGQVASPQTINLKTCLGIDLCIGLIGAATGDQAGFAVAGAGDVNDDRVADVVVGAPFADPQGRADAGSGYVVYGSATLPPLLYADALGTAGVAIEGASDGDRAGFAVGGGGDLNGDDRPDTVVGGDWADAPSTNSGAAYVVYGFGVPRIRYLGFGGELIAKVGTSIGSFAPAVQRTGPASFVATTPLPDGLSIDPATGVLAGTPTAARDAADYTVTMTDLAGQATTSLRIAIEGSGVTEQPPGDGSGQPPDGGQAPSSGQGQQGGEHQGRCSNTLRGTRRADRLKGTAAGDRIAGGRGNDRIKGGAGDDCLAGQQGNDRIDGGSGRDSLDGGKGRDTLKGGRGVDRFNGGAGNDRINAADGKRETVRCGAGRDTVKADRRDRLVGCERIKRVKRA